MPTRQPHRLRLIKLRRWLVREDLDAVVLTDAAQLRYLVSYTGSNGLLAVRRRDADFLTDGRYREQAREEVHGARIHVVSGDLIGQLSQIRELGKGRPRIGYVSQLTSEQSAQRLRSVLPRAVFLPTDDPVAPLMQLKYPAEIASIKCAAAIADRAFAALLPMIKPGVPERELAAKLEYAMTMAGSEKLPFETIVVSGPRSALPHGRASSRRIRRGDFVTIDFGATVDGYVCDMTRTVAVGPASPKQKRIYALVLRAQQAAIARARAGVSCVDLDTSARRLIERAGLGRYFDHGLGHGIGLAVHEGPGVNPRSKTVLQPGMVITIEPGVYIPGWGGVRIEDDIVIGRRGATVITHAERKLLEL